MRPSLRDRLRHVIDAIDEAQALVADRTFEDFAQDRVLRLAIERLLEIISEASRHIPQELKELEPAMPWRRIADLGNRLRHAYHNVDILIIWTIATEDLTPLKCAAEALSRKSDAD